VHNEKDNVVIDLGSEPYSYVENGIDYNFLVYNNNISQRRWFLGTGLEILYGIQLLTDEFERFLEVLLEVGMSVVQDGKSLVHDAGSSVVHSRGRALLAGGHVQHACHPDGGHTIPVVSVFAVTKVQEWQHLGERVGVHGLAVHIWRAAGDQRRRQQGVLAHVLMPRMKLFVAT